MAKKYTNIKVATTHS